MRHFTIEHSGKTKFRIVSYMCRTTLGPLSLNALGVPKLKVDGLSLEEAQLAVTALDDAMDAKLAGQPQRKRK